MLNSTAVTRAAPMWAPYTLRRSDPAANRTEPELIEVGTTNAWTVDMVVNALAAHAVTWHHTAGEWVHAKGRPTVDELRAWIDQTRALADRLPLSGATPDLMRQAAAKVETSLSISARFLKTWPTLGTKADANRRASLHLWAIDRLLRTLNTLESQSSHGREYPLTKVWPAVFGVADSDEPAADYDEPAFADYNEAQKRIARIEDAIVPNQHDWLMAHVLRGVLATS